MKASDYVLLRATGEVFRDLPLEIQAMQNLAAARQAPRDAIDLAPQGYWLLLSQLNDPVVRQIIEQRARDMFAAQVAVDCTARREAA